MTISLDIKAFCRLLDLISITLFQKNSGQKRGQKSGVAS